jgi:hypothetical protein
VAYVTVTLIALWLVVIAEAVVIWSFILSRRKLMALLDDVLAKIQPLTDTAAGISTLLSSIHQKYLDCLAGVTLPADVTAKIQAVGDGVQANIDALNAAIVANTDAAVP